MNTARHSWNEPIRTLIYAILIALLFRSFVFEPFHIPSGSMKDTLLIGDYIFVSKYSYGYSRYSFPYGLPLFEGRVMQSAPARGDVVVFRPPNQPRVDFIKRVMGLPGDRVQVRGGEVYINDEKLPQVLDSSFDDALDDGTKVHARRYVETLPEGKKHAILDITPYGKLDNTDVYTVPEGHYFMMGDNRDNSEDSRVSLEEGGIGFIPEANIIGRAEIIVFSVGDNAQFWQFWKWPTAIRVGRFLTWVN
ncbi:MAG: signal peptidase I [Rickettsiales bacterium]|jgi:signal peptidase I|nr:signal peptidase I [Rickettsiales bacterium]